MKAILPFYTLFVGDGTATNFTLDTAVDPYYFSERRIVFNVSDALPDIVSLSPSFDLKNKPSAVFSASAHNGLNGNDLGAVIAVINQYQITFMLAAAPASGTFVVVQGFLQF